jgi:hypothetical protein
MARKDSDTKTLDLKRAEELLESNWQVVTTEAGAEPGIQYLDDAGLRRAIESSINHKQVTFRFCLPVQILGKLTDSNLDSLRLQQALRFIYPLPPRISLEDSLSLAQRFLEERSGGDRSLALCGALFDAIGIHFGLYSRVERARINATDEATGQAADLECIDAGGKVILAVEVKDRILTLSDVEGTLRKGRQRKIKDIFFSAPGMKSNEKRALEERITRAFTSGQNIYVFDFISFARSVLALGGESIRTTFLQKVGEHLDLWNTQPVHRQAWKKLLENI